MREQAITPAKLAACYRPIQSFVFILFFTATFACISSNRAVSSDNLSEHIAKALTLLISEFPDSDRPNPTSRGCQQSTGHQLEFACAAKLRCSLVFAHLNDTQIFYIEHFSRPKPNDCDEKHFVSEVTAIVRTFFDLEVKIASNISEEMRRGAHRYSQGERNPELTNKDHARLVSFNNGVGYLTVSREAYPGEYVTRLRFRWDRKGH
jgi:hypothetical protein